MWAQNRETSSSGACSRALERAEFSVAPGQSSITYDESRWPYVLITMPARELSDAEFLEHLADMATYASRPTPFGLVIDARVAPTPNAARRRLIAEGMDRALELDGHRCIGIAIVLDDALKRAFFNTIRWLRRAEHPLTAVATPSEGMAWLRQLQGQQVRKVS